MHRRLATIALWAGTAALLVYTGTQPRPSAAVGLPTVGTRLPIDSLETELGVVLAHGSPTWLLVVTSSCPACLSLDVELDAMRAAAECRDLEIVPVVIAIGLPPDSMFSVLERGSIPGRTAVGALAFDLLRVRSVPTLLELDPKGRITRVGNPVAGDWPPTSDCDG